MRTPNPPAPEPAALHAATAATAVARARLPQDHPERLLLADEVHARPPEPLHAPARASYVAVLVDPADRDAERAHLDALFAAYGVPAAPSGVNHLSAALGALRLKWERHGEFSGYTFLADGTSPVPFAEPPTTMLPAGWLEGIPGRTVVGAHARVERLDDAPAIGAGTGPGPVPDAAVLAARYFENHIVVGSSVAEGAGWVFTDFRIHADGCIRFVLLDRHFTPRQAGRMLQRLFEIDAYRMLALLSLPMARAAQPRIRTVEDSLARLAENIARDDGRDEELLHELSRLAAEVEREIAASQYRFGATRAYADLVKTRIAELRERRIDGMQPIEEFMARRFAPAVATCATVSQRLLDLSQRVARASTLLATRVGIARERQNQALLASMDRRAKLQLRLQATVEGLSVAAIVYYVAGLVGYLAKGAKAAGAGLNPELVVALVVPVAAVITLAVTRRARRRIAPGPDGH